MFYTWRQDDSPPCGADHTVTVTQTVLQGASTSTVINLIDPLTTDSISLPTDSPSVGLNAAEETTLPTSASLFSQLDVVVSTALSGSPEPTVSVTTTASTTKTLNLVSATSGSSEARPTPTECPSRNVSSSASASAGTIAGSVVGSMAGVALIAILVSYLLKRKRRIKLTFKRKVVQENNQQACPGELEDVKPGRDHALETLERRTSIPSPRVFDFGFISSTGPSPSISRPPVARHATPVAPAQWL